MQNIENLFADRVRINISWLITLRWVAVLGQAATILVAAYVLHVQLDVTGLALLVGLTAATNAGFQIARRIWGGQWNIPLAWRGVLLGSIMTVDILILTVLLYCSGGPFNPFVLFYLVHVALAGVLLPPRWSWFICGIALICHGGLFLAYWRWMGLEGSIPAANLKWSGIGVVMIPRLLYQVGHYVSTAIAAMTTVYFVTRLTSEMAILDDDLSQARQRKARSEKLESLATLAAGTAHELGSPLATIAVVAKELERQLRSANVPPGALDDLQLIRSELSRCREILDHMAVNAGDTMGEPLTRIDPDRLIKDALGMLRTPERVSVDLKVEAPPGRILGPHRTLAQVLRGLMQNALDASGSDGRIDIVVLQEKDALRLDVRDQGQGMSDEILSRVGEPFFTTKEPGHGMGLGLFLARSVIEKLGGTLELRSSPGRGTVVSVILPLAPF